MRTIEPRRARRVLAVVTVLAVFAYLLHSAREPLRMNWGDPWSDANVLTALNYSSRYGFIATSFTDVLDIGPLTPESYRYTHYPPFAEILYGCVRRVLGGGAPLGIAVFRGFAIGFSALGLLSFSRWVRELWGRDLSLVATILCASNLLWLQFADSIHQSPIVFATGMTALFGVARWSRGDSAKKHGLAIVAGTYICFLTAYDYYFFLPTMALLTARLLGVALISKRMFRLAAMVAAAGALSIATKCAFVVGALGWKGFVSDLHFQFLERATTHFSPDYRLGIFIILLGRWTSYFTPLPFVVAAVALVDLVRRARRKSFVGSVKAVLFGNQPLRGPASLLCLLVAGLPFVVVFSELAAEQVLPSQVILPFAIVAAAWALTSLGRTRPLLEGALLASVFAWQLFHFSRVPKAFLDPGATEQVRAYLRESDTADFVISNVMADGPVQYFFERHLHPPADTPELAASGYVDMMNSTPSRVMHAIHFEDPNTRFIDKSLWPLLSPHDRWRVLGAPYLHRAAALAAIEDWDRRVVQQLERHAVEVLHTGGLRVFRFAEDVAARRRASVAKLTHPTRFIDFGTDEASAHTLSGFRVKENYPGVPGFRWTVAHAPKRTLLTKRGLVWKQDLPPTLESVLLLRLEPGRDHRVRLLAWSSINDQTLSATINGQTVLSNHVFAIGQTREEIEFVIPQSALGSEERVHDLIFKFRDVADYGGGVAFATMHVDPLDGGVR